MSTGWFALWGPGGTFSTIKRGNDAINDLLRDRQEDKERSCKSEVKTRRVGIVKRTILELGGYDEDGIVCSSVRKFAYANAFISETVIYRVVTSTRFTDSPRLYVHGYKRSEPYTTEDGSLVMDVIVITHPQEKFLIDQELRMYTGVPTAAVYFWLPIY